jgi:anthranilate phosphoribosyltransferase
MSTETIQETTDSAQERAPRPTAKDPLQSAVEAIQLWQRALESAADFERDAELLEARAVLQACANPELKNDGARKAAAALETAEAWRRAKHAQARAKAAGALVDLLVGSRGRS